MESEPTVIIKSMKELNQLLYSNMDSQKPDGMQQPSNLTNVSRLKLSFSDSVCSVDSVDASSINLRLTDSTTFNYEDSMTVPSFSEKHQNSIAGFDVCKRLRDKDKEIIEGKAKITLLESKAGNFQALNKKMAIQYESEIEILRKKAVEDKEQAAGMKLQIQGIKETEDKLRSEISNIKKSSDVKICGAEDKLHGSQESHVKEIISLMEERDNLRKEVSTLRNESEESKFKMAMNEEEKTNLQEQLNTISSNYSSSDLLKHEIEDLKVQLSKSELNIKELNIRLETLRDTDNKQKLLDKSLIRLSTLEAEASKLKEENHTFRISALNIDLMEEKLSSFEKEMEAVKRTCANLTEENATLITLRNLSEQCESVIQEQLKLQYSPSPIELKNILADLCSCDADLRNSVAELKASVKSHETSRENQEALLGKFRAELDEKQEKLNKDSQLIRRLQRKLLMVSKERDSLKDIITSYESESTLNITALEKRRIAALNEQLTSYQQELARVESEFGVTSSSLGTGAVKNSDNKLADKVVDLEKKVVELEELVEIITEEKQALEVRIDTQLPKGTFNPVTTKVVQFVNNPLAESHAGREQQVSKLQKENETLKCRLKLIDDGEQLNLTQKVVTNVDSKRQIKELMDKNEAAELRNKRLMEVFRRKAHDLRDVISRLIGYRVDVGNDGKYKLFNTYSESQNDFLLFQQSSNGALKLLETPFLANLGDMMEEYLEPEVSYPGFLAAITLSLIRKMNSEDDPSDVEDEAPSEAEGEPITDDDDLPSEDQPASDVEEGQSDVEECQSDIEEGQSDIEEGQSDIEEGQSDMEDQHGDERGNHYSDLGEPLSDDMCSEEEDLSEDDCPEEEMGEEEEEERPAKRIKMDNDDDDDDDLICLD